MNLEKIRRKLLSAPIKTKSKKIAAVLILIHIKNNNNIELIFEKRVEKLQRHSGEISFPGGVRENDETPLETALRETEEEIGIKKEDIEILGYLRPTKVKSSGFIIIPVVGYLKREPKFNVNEKEVEKVLVLNLDDIKVNKKKTILGEYYKVGEYVIWGATARLLNQLLKIFEKDNM
ncbi:MAG: NUDIX hydrolase [Candidatus Njordarchaeia archaeon]